MSSKFESLKKELSTLVAKGDLLYISMIVEVRKDSAEAKKKIEKDGVKLPSFEKEYDAWYSESLRVIKQILPDRLEDFVKLYKFEKRKEIDSLTYGISDYLLGIRTSRAGRVIADQEAALPKMKLQVSILTAAEKRFESSLFDIEEILRADLFDSEIDAGKALSKNGFHRAGGAVVGVVLEKHLNHVCQIHGLKSKKAHPTISEFNDQLKEAGVIDIPKWRFIQHLGDLRNLCDHGKDREPTKDDVLELAEGTDKILKTLF